MGRVVITGSSGLVGTAVVSYALRETNHHLILADTKPPRNEEFLNHPRVQHFTADLTVPENWTHVCKGADALIHLSAVFVHQVGPWKTHNTNVVLSWNALCAAVEARVTRVALASSVNAIGGLYNKECPGYKYFPVDENHPPLTEESYSVSKLILEAQADCIARANPDIRIASIRPHFVADTKPVLPVDAEGRKDLWGWVNSEAIARAFFLGLEMKEKGVRGHEAFFIVGPEHCCDGNDAKDLANRFYPNTMLKSELSPRQGFFSCSKAEQILGWKHEGGAVPEGNW